MTAPPPAAARSPHARQPAAEAASGAAAPPLDLRLVGPALAAWAAAWAVLGSDAGGGGSSGGPGSGPGGVPGVVWLVGALLPTAGLALAVAGLRRTVCGLLLSAGAAALSAGLALTGLHRGPVPELARRQDTAELEIRVRTDPRLRVGGGTVGGPRVVLDAEVERVGRTAVGTPVVVVAQGRSARLDRWSVLLPSTRVLVRARVAPVEPGEPVAAALLVRGPPRVVAGPSTVQRWAGGLRAGLLRATDPLPADARALLPGLVVGDTGRFTEELDEAFRGADLAHLTAVSGGNLAIVLVVLIGAPARARTPGRGGLAGSLGLPLRCTAVAGAVLVAGFVVLCRPGPSVLRAAASGAVTLLALATGRRAHALPALAGACLVLVLADPWLARSYGFGLSVLATAGLLTLGPRWAEALTRRHWPPWLAEALAAAAAAQLFCAPLLVLMAARVSLVAIPCNLLAEPAVGPATLLGLGALLVQPVWGWGARALAAGGALPALWIARVARWGAGLPGAELSWPAGVAGGLLLAAVLAALAHALPVLRRGWLLPCVLALVLLAVLLRPAPVRRLFDGWPPGDWDLVVCSVGQGDAIAVRAGPGSDAALVVDSGPDPRAVDRCLRGLGVTRVPLLLLTHLHADHVDGVPGVLRGRRVGAIETTVLDDPPAEAARLRRWAAADRVPVLRARAGERRTLGRLAWTVLWPPAELPADAPGPNNASVAVLLTVNGLRVALLGDLEPPAQRELPSWLGRVDVLKVPHHGSGQQDGALLARLRPRLALISCGAHNLYGHPSPRTVRRLAALGTLVLRTDTQGDLAVLGDARHLSAETHPEPPP